MKLRIVFALILLAVIAGCSPNKLLVREFDATIIDAAQKAKAAGATELSVEVAVTSGYKGSASIPVTVVTFGGESSLNVSTKFTAKVDLTEWKPPMQVKNIDSSGYFILDTDTMQLHEIK